MLEIRSMKTWLRTKALDVNRASRDGLPRTLSWPHLLALGVGAIVGTGILTLIGVGAERAGPAVLLSFVVAGAISICAALAYAELSTMIPASGSAYTYSYIAIGEIVAWVVGWSLMLEYSLVVGTVAVGWSGYASPLLISLGFPAALTQSPALGGIINLPAIVIIAVVAALLMRGARESARVNTVLVIVKIATLALFVAVALPAFDASNLEPFMPFGFGKTAGSDGIERGVMPAAAIIFFAYYGFDAISTAAEESIKPSRDLVIGIVGSLVACTVIYLSITVAAIGAVPFRSFSDSPEPLALILRELNQGGVARIVAIAAVITLPTVILAFLYGQTRVFLAMARDGFLPSGLARVSQRGSPSRVIVVTATVVAILAGLFPIAEIAALANAGTLIAFAAVGLCLLVLRRKAPDAPRPFRTPAVWVVGVGGILGCAYLFSSLPARTIISCLVWNVAGLCVYFAYGRARSALHTKEP